MPDPLLATHDLRHRYGRREVLRGLDLAVTPGTVYGFLGRNGAGKTTTLRALMGILRPTAGTIAYDGTTVRHTTTRMKRRIGYVSQEQHFYPWMKVRRLGRFVGAFYPTWDKAAFARLLDDLAIEPGQPVGALSGGTRMKLAIALALAHGPKLLLLDEPTAGVDPIARREILDTLRREATVHGRTVFFSTHHISEVEDIGDEVGVLHEGRLFYQGPLSGLRDRVRRYRGAAPPGITELSRSGEVAIGHGEPATWQGLPATPTTLEEAFVAIAGRAAAGATPVEVPEVPAVEVPGAVEPPAAAGTTPVEVPEVPAVEVPGAVEPPAAVDDAASRPSPTPATHEDPPR